MSDTTSPGYDPRTDLSAFVMEKGERFEASVMRLLGDRYPVT